MAPTKHSVTNQRGDHRYLVSVRSNLHGVETNESARIADLSCSGARLERRPDQPWQHSRACTLVVEIDRVDAEPLKLLAIPMWFTPNALGVKFLLLDDMDRLALAEIIDETRLAA